MVSIVSGVDIAINSRDDPAVLIRYSIELINEREQNQRTLCQHILHRSYNNSSSKVSTLTSRVRLLLEYFLNLFFTIDKSARPIKVINCTRISARKQGSIRFVKKVGVTRNLSDSRTTEAMGRTSFAAKCNGRMLITVKFGHGNSTTLIITPLQTKVKRPVFVELIIEIIIG